MKLVRDNHWGRHFAGCRQQYYLLFRTARVFRLSNIRLITRCTFSTTQSRLLSFHPNIGKTSKKGNKGNKGNTVGRDTSNKRRSYLCQHLLRLRLSWYQGLIILSVALKFCMITVQFHSWYYISYKQDTDLLNRPLSDITILINGVVKQLVPLSSTTPRRELTTAHISRGCFPMGFRQRIICSVFQ